MSEANAPADHDEPYKLLSVSKSPPPDGSEGADWVTYTISQGHNVITGYRQGNPKTIRADVEIIVATLNERRQGRRGRVHLTRPKGTEANGRKA